MVGTVTSTGDMDRRCFVFFQYYLTQVPLKRSTIKQQDLWNKDKKFDISIFRAI